MKISREDILSMIPVKNTRIRIEHKAKGTVIILKRKRNLFIDILAFIFQIPDEKRIEIDATGTKVLQLCDGFNSINKIVENLMRDDFKNIRKEDVENAIFKYLTQLSKRRVLGFIRIKK